jgi:hypothetical protein
MKNDELLQFVYFIAESPAIPESTKARAWKLIAKAEGRPATDQGEGV